MSDKIKVSVIIPVYNSEKFLKKCLESIMYQSFKEIEIIIINDGSTDRSLKIIEQFMLEDERIILINQKNQGVSVARNRGIEVAKGEFLLNVDSDDWIEKNYIEILYKKALEKNLDIVISDVYFEYLAKKGFILKDLNLKEDEVITGNEYCNIFIEKNFHGYSCNKLIKKALYIDNNIYYRKEISILEDAEVILKLGYYAKRIGKINGIFYHYLQHSHSTSKKMTEKKVMDIKDVIEKLIDFFDDEEKKKKLQLIKIEKSLLGIKYLNNKKYAIVKNEILKEIQQLEWKYFFKNLKLKREKLYIFINKFLNNEIIFDKIIKNEKYLMKLLKK